jgi:hypothetical protein
VANKKELVAEQIAKAVGAGKLVALDTVDFSDPNRPKTCLEVDFPILPVNQVAVIEGNASKPIYQMSKWWARRRSSIFRTMLIAAATKAPDDPSHAAKLAWDSYYANHQKRGAFKHLKVADIFMGGGTTLVEGSRLGMQMFGNDLNPVAWFVVKQELSSVDLDEVKHLLADIEAEVRPQIIPYYHCDGPNGEKGKWTHVPTGRAEPSNFNPFQLSIEQRKEYEYEGPELIYTFWAKHGPCQVTGCGHRTPIITSPIVATKTLSVKHWKHQCKACGKQYDVERGSARMAPDAPLYVSPEETPYSVFDPKRGFVCPHCQTAEIVKLDKGETKKVDLALLIHPEWLAGSPKVGEVGAPVGSAIGDNAQSTKDWYLQRGSTLRLLEVRGLATIRSVDKITGIETTERVLPAEVICPATRLTIKTGPDGGNVPRKSVFACQSPTCGQQQDVLSAISSSKTAAPCAPHVIQGWSEQLDRTGNAYGGRFFTTANTDALIAAETEWAERRDTDLAEYWPRTDVPSGLETSVRTPLIKYGYKTWASFFNARQLLVHAQLLRAIDTLPGYSTEARGMVLAAFQQYLRNNNMFCIWNIQRDHIEPFLSKNNFQPPTRPVENCVFGKLGRGNWTSCIEGIVEGIEWKARPWELVAKEHLPKELGQVLGAAKSARVYTGDPEATPVTVTCESSTELSGYATGQFDLVVTDPPFGDIMQYAELSGLFYAWLRLVLQKETPAFKPEQPPSALEAVENAARHGKDSTPFYARILTACWKEAHRILKPAGMLTFTFHHDKDEPWVAVLESLFEAGFYLEATYPVRSDETKGEGGTPGTFGAQKVEYDVLHVCRKRTEEPTPVSWGRMRREVLADVRQLQSMLENHAKGGLPAADLQVIRRGKALEYFSRHYGKVFVDQDRVVSVKEALVGINQLLDEDGRSGVEKPPITAEPLTRQFLRMFDGKTELPRDQMQKFLRGSGVAPDEFEQRGWCSEKGKVFSLVQPLDFAREWHGKHKRRLTSDLDQALVLIGACYDASGINALDTLKSGTFRPHAALKALIEWMTKRGASSPIRNAASRALSIYSNWVETQAPTQRQADLFSAEEGYA